MILISLELNNFKIHEPQQQEIPKLFFESSNLRERVKFLNWKGWGNEGILTHKTLIHLIQA